MIVISIILIVDISIKVHNIGIICGIKEYYNDVYIIILNWQFNVILTNSLDH